MPTIAIRGAVIAKQTDLLFDWYMKCEKCGNIDDMNLQTSNQVSPFSPMQQPVQCTRCGNIEWAEFHGA